MTQANLGSSAAPAGDPPLLATKLYVPRVHGDMVARPRLLKRMDNVLSVPLTLIAAPAGFGKTTTVIQWLHEAACPVGWVSLDAQDNDPATFLRYLVAALQTVVPAAGAPTLALL